MTISLRKVNDEVFVADASIVRLGVEHITFLKKQALESNRKRARICTHHSNDDALHEMLIAICADSYIHPHKHIQKMESFHIIEGAADVVIFDDSGAIIDVVELGDLSTGKNFYYRLSDSLFHTLLIHSDFLVLHEVTNGPFIANEAILGSFAPYEEQREAAIAYLTNTKRMIQMHRLSKQEKKH